MEVTMSGKRYTEEFKIEAVKQVVDRGYSVSSVSKRLGTQQRAFTNGSINSGSLIHSTIN